MDLLRRSNMDVSESISKHSFNWRNDSKIESSNETIIKQESVKSKEAIFAPHDELKVTVRSGGLSDIEIMEYFEKNTNSSSQKHSLEDLKNKLIDLEKSSQSILNRLHHIEDSDRESQIRQMLYELEQARDLEKIIFGESNNLEDTDNKNPRLRYKIDLKFEVQSKQVNFNEIESYTDISKMQFLPRREADPLVIDLGNDGIQTTGVNKGIKFDLNGDDKPEQSSFVKGNDYALALDKNKNGFIDSGKELFGDQNGSKDGIEELKHYDENNDGKINEKDSVFSSLVLINADRNPKNLTQAGIDSIDLTRLEKAGFTSSGDRIKDGLKVDMLDGSTRNALDVFFQYRK